MHNIPFSLIVNQIDKHDDNELSYETFIHRLNTTLENHGITPEHIFTTSIYDTPYRQNNELETFLKELDQSRKEFKARYHDRIIKNIESKHVDYLNDTLSNLQVEEKTISDLKAHISYLEEEKKIIEPFLHNDKVFFYGTEKFAMEKSYRLFVEKGVLKNAPDNEMILTGVAQKGKKKLPYQKMVLEMVLSKMLTV